MKKRFIFSLISLAALLALVLAWFAASKTIESVTKERLIQPQTLVVYWVQELSLLCPKDLESLRDRASLTGYAYLQIATKNNANPWVEIRMPEAMNWEIPSFKEVPNTLAFNKYRPTQASSDIFDIYSPFYLDHSPNCEALQKADGTTVRAADLKGPDGYVRVGYSAELINLQVTVQLLQISGITLLALLLYSFAVWWIAQRLYPALAKDKMQLEQIDSSRVRAIPDASLDTKQGETSELDNTEVRVSVPSTLLIPTLTPEKINRVPSPEAAERSQNNLSNTEEIIAPASAMTETTEIIKITPAPIATGLLLDDLSKQAQLDGQPLTLTPKEFDILKLLASQPGRVFSNEEILKNVWPEGSYASSQDVKQYVYFLRRKIEKDPQNPQRLVTVRGFGYKLNP